MHFLYRFITVFFCLHLFPLLKGSDCSKCIVAPLWHLPVILPLQPLTPVITPVTISAFLNTPKTKTALSDCFLNISFQIIRALALWDCPADPVLIPPKTPAFIDFLGVFPALFRPVPSLPIISFNSLLHNQTRHCTGKGGDHICPYDLWVKHSHIRSKRHI